MSAAPDIVRNAALRRLLDYHYPESLRCNRNAWRAWLARRGSSLVDTALPKAFLAIRVGSIEDVILHTAMLQILRHPGFLPLVVLVLPNRVAARLAWVEAMAEGWASLVTITSDADWATQARRLPPEARLINFHFPAGFDFAGLSAALCHDGKTNAWRQLSAAIRPVDAAWIGFAGELPKGERQAWLPELDAHLDCVATTAGDIPFPPSEPGQIERSSALSDVVLRPRSMILPSVSDDDLIAVTGTSPDGRLVVAALQPAALRENDGGLATPLPPHMASTEVKQIEVLRLCTSGAVDGFRVAAQIQPSAIGPWMLSAYLNRGGAGNPVVSAFARGTGCRLAYAEDELAMTETLGSIPVVWGVLRGSDEIIARAKAQGLHHFYIDHAYFDRGHGKSYRISRNAYEAGPVRNAPGDRFLTLDVTIEPWRKSGRSIIVCPPTDFYAAAHNCPNWLEETLTKLKMETDRPIIIRTKPEPGKPFVPLPTALENAHALVTHSSNVAIEAVCLGTPVFVAPTSAAAPVGQTDLGLIETPRYPKREGWLWHLAYSQFTLEEFQSGEAWKIMQQHEDRICV